jgi:redox-sensing transcriptional repressor
VAGSEQIPIPAIRRLSLYLRQLETFDNIGRETVSSHDLGQSLGLSDAQVRKDLGYFGQFGQPGVGYRVPELIERVRGILGTNKTTNVVLVRPLLVRPMRDLAAVVRRHAVRIGLLAVPASAGQQVAQMMVDAGIRGILNFAPVILRVNSGVIVSPVDLSVHLEQLVFQVSGCGA